VILTDRPDLRDALRTEIRDVTAGHGADLVIDLVGGDLLDASLRALAWRGRLVVVGFASARIPTIKANYLLLKNISVTGLEWASYPTKVPDEVHAAQRLIFEMLGDGRIDPHIGATFALDDTAAALRMMKDRQVVGKILIKMRDDS
jgi:NADPH2:quinone reductase